MYILNAFDDQFRMEVLGFAPESKLPYTNEVIKKALNELYNSSKTKGKKGIINFMLNTFKNTRQVFPIFFDENSNVKKLQGEDIEGIKEYFMRELKPLEGSLHLFFNFDVECEDALEDPWVLCECKPEKINTRELFCPQLPQELKEHEHATTYPEIFNYTKEFIYI